MSGASAMRGTAAFLVALVVQCSAGTTEDGLKFLDENREREEITELPSGLQYEILKSGPVDNPSPNVSSPCVVHYTGMLMDGTVFDSSHKRGQPTTFQPKQVVKGWTEALQLMRAGDLWKLYLPSELAYGDSGAGGKIPPGAVLLFELELLEVKEEMGLAESIVDTFKQQPMLVFMILGTLYMLWQNYTGGASAVGKEALSIETAAEAKENAKVFFDVKIGDEEPKRVEFQLFSKHYPKTAENFRALCTGEKGKGKSGKQLTYKGSKFHRIIPGFMCQGGDFTRGNGQGGESIYGEKFDDEWDSGYISHDKGGMLSMANAGKNTNGSQFFITNAACRHLNGKHVIFGQVVEGMEVVKEMEAVGSGSGSTSKPIVIEDCGELKGKST